MRRVLLLVGAVMILSGCYHASIETGRTPGTTVIKQAFASSWIYGLVPPKTVETAALCPNGVAKVETRLSFVNQLVGFLTFGIYTPMEITVTCAAEGNADATIEAPDLVIESGASEELIQKTFADAADQSVKLGRPVYVLMQSASGI